MPTNVGKSKKRHFDMVSADPADLLKQGPPVRLRPRHKGDIIGDALFFGDSLTWGMAHNYTGRYPTPWPRLLEKRLRNVGLRVVEAAICSRTTCWDDPDNEELIPGTEPHHFNGLHHFSTVFSCHSPKWLFVLLGTNDLKRKIRAEAEATNSDSSAEEEEGEEGRSSGGDTESSAKAPVAVVDAYSIASNCAKICEKAREMFEGHCHEGQLKVLLIAPPRVRLTELSREMGYDKRSVEISEGFPEAFEQVAKEHQLLFTSCDINMEESVDGVHITERANSQIAEAVWETMQSELPRFSRPTRRFDDEDDA